MLVGAGELVEQGRFAAVLISGQRKCQHRSIRQRVFALFGVVAAALAQARVLHHPAGLPCRSCCGCFRRGDLDPCRIVQPQGQLIAVDLQLHGVTHGGEFHQCYIRAGDQPHIQKVLPQRPLSPYIRDTARLTNVQFVQCHTLFSLCHIFLSPLQLSIVP